MEIDEEYLKYKYTNRLVFLFYYENWYSHYIALNCFTRNIIRLCIPL